jgi:dUTP pyrophosphatase
MASNKLAKDPTKTNDTDAGYDLYMAQKRTVITGHSKETVSTGIIFGIPAGYRLEIKERSGVGSSTPLRVCAGVIDQEYRGEVKVVLENTSPYPFTIEPGFKIAQAVLYHNIHLALTENTELDTETVRGAKGFGSSDEV